jgi:hypothetical protein
MRFASPLLVMVLLLGSSPSLPADSRTRLKGPPMILGHEVREFVLVAPVSVGKKLPPGLPTTITYEMLPNRFIAACEDGSGIFYQAVGPFQNVVGGGRLGGLCVTKSAPVEFYPYTGDARYLRMPLFLQAPLSIADLRKVHFVRTNEKK